MLKLFIDIERLLNEDGVDYGEGVVNDEKVEEKDTHNISSEDSFITHLLKRELTDEEQKKFNAIISKIKKDSYDEGWKDGADAERFMSGS